MQFGEVLPAGLAALRVGPEGLRIEPELVSEKRQQGCGRGFARAEHPAGKAQVGQVHRKAETVGLAAPLPDEGQVLTGEGVVSHDGADLPGWVKQGRAGLRREELSRRHGRFLTRNPSVPQRHKAFVDGCSLVGIVLGRPLRERLDVVGA